MNKIWQAYLAGIIVSAGVLMAWQDWMGKEYVMSTLVNTPPIVGIIVCLIGFILFNKANRNDKK